MLALEFSITRGRTTSHTFANQVIRNLIEFAATCTSLNGHIIPSSFFKTRGSLHQHDENTIGLTKPPNIDGGKPDAGLPLLTAQENGTNLIS